MQSSLESDRGYKEHLCWSYGKIPNTNWLIDMFTVNPWFPFYALLRIVGWTYAKPQCSYIISNCYEYTIYLDIDGIYCSIRSGGM